MSLPMNHTDPRLYLSPDHAVFGEGAELSLMPQQAHYLGNVMRRKAGQTVRVFNGLDGEWEARLISLRRSEAVISLTRLLRSQTDTRPLELVFSLLKREATELVIRMGTELGVTRFHPVITARTNHHRLNEERLILIAQEAAEQCERLDIPVISPLQPLSDCLTIWPEQVLLFAALERQEHTEDTRYEKAMGLIAGPEGGFTPDEMLFLRHHKAVRPLSLGPRILRAETAICAGLALLNTR
ncbi:16S rRNA (uracil(1498)-N(3))-methyltransferase [Acetobacteraceae bacterium ESL0709]|nr:16S rRNA (uracil(1498)-N(3))-methyltransferase [Acetobacteraceae bacterium ESL0697]MDF7678249.1 16S rRNA (uracil(1498)-N(3))-methyltransferase [Acetobacteraceae bacterium ESL0709]